MMIKNTRGREHRVEIRASIEAVWKALVDADEIVRWYAPAAEVDPREGGRYWISWGEGMAGVSRIEAFDAERRLLLVHAWEGAAELDPPIMEEYLLEAHRDVTVLRLVQSGIPASADWDDFYEDTGRGWKMFLAGLRHYLEKHLGMRATRSCSCSPSPFPSRTRGESSSARTDSRPTAVSTMSSSGRARR